LYKTFPLRRIFALFPIPATSISFPLARRNLQSVQQKMNLSSVVTQRALTGPLFTSSSPDILTFLRKYLIDANQ
jgi:hypothetical protein